MRIPTKRDAIDLVRRLRLNKWLIEGQERHTHEPLRVVYTGHRPGLRFIRDLAFDRGYRQKHLGKVWSFGRTMRLKESARDALHFTETSEAVARRVAGDRGFYIPMWVNGVLDIDEALTRSKRIGNIKEDLRRIRKNKLEYDVTADDREIADFHRNMYVPYIRNTFGPRALFHSLSTLKQSRGSIELLQIIKDGEPVAGQILVYEDSEVRTREIGVKDGDRQLVKLGVMGAIYYFGLLHLQNKGYSAVSVGGSRPWLNDGVIRFKKKWGMRLEKPWPSGLLLVAPQSSDGTAAFLRNNPFLSITGNQLRGVVFIDSYQDIGSDGIRKVHRDYFYDGMSRLEIYPLTARPVAREVPEDIANVVCQRQFFWHEGH